MCQAGQIRVIIAWVKARVSRLAECGGPWIEYSIRANKFVSVCYYTGLRLAFR